jgi:NADPH:quinone reductase-like Zn-dependent oxidoreductase
MKAAVINAAGGPDVFQFETVPDPQPGDTDVLVRVEAISIEGGDLADRREGRTLYPAVMGYAAAGTIVKLGRAVNGFRIGQKVTTFAFGGSHAELRVAPASTTFAVPDGMDMGVAAAIPCGPGTAALALNLGRLQPNDTVLVTGATGGVGSAAVQIAAAKGARVIGTARSLESLEQLKKLGLSDAIVSGGTPLNERVVSICGRGADLLIDTVGGRALTDGLIALADGGRAVMVGVIGGFNTPIDTGHLLMHRLTVTGCFMGPIMALPDTRRLIEDLIQDCAEGRLTVPIDSRFNLAEMPDAYRRAEQAGRLGRVIVTV